MNKLELRKLYKHKRSGISSDEADKWEDQLLIQFQRLPVFIPEILLSFAPLEKFNEPDPSLIERYCAFKQPLLQLCYPVTNADNLTLTACLINDQTAFKYNSYGIPEPVGAEIIEAENIQMVLLPLLAFDMKGYRVGYGKGYYDRFLMLCPEAIKIGLSFFDAEEVIDDISTYDLAMDFCVTPSMIYEF